MIHQAVIVAGGKGERFGKDTPKQFLDLLSRPVLSWSVDVFLPLVEDLVVVLPEDQISNWLRLTGTRREEAGYIITNGGSTRSESVLNGLEALPKKDNALIAIHDAARPLIKSLFVSELYQICREHGSAVPVTRMRDSLRRIDEAGRSEPVDREKVVAVQTPQVFKAGALRAAYASSDIASFTDDASLMEASGSEVFLTPGGPWNIKLTYPEDLKVAEALIIK